MDGERMPSPRGLHAFTIVSLYVFHAVLNVRPAGAAPFVYFTQNGSSINAIHRIDAAGGASQILQSNPGDPFGVDVDVQGGKVYWTDTATDSIQRKNLDGSGSVELLITTGLNDPHEIALDVNSGKMYFADRFGGAIKRANLDGTSVEILVGSGLPQHIALDLVNQKIYWSDAFSRINQSNLDGSAAATIFSGPDSIAGLAIDPFAGTLYFGNRSQQKIQRADLDGSNVADAISGLARPPLDIAFDVDGQVMYWSFFDSIQSGDLASPGAVETLISGLQGSELLSGVNGLALGLAAPVPEPSTAVLLGAGLLFLGVRRKRGPR